jgi:hypothetical protein
METSLGCVGDVVTVRPIMLIGMLMGAGPNWLWDAALHCTGAGVPVLGAIFILYSVVPVSAQALLRSAPKTRMAGYIE